MTIADEYVRSAAIYGRLYDVVDYMIKSEVEKRGIKTHSTLGRVKEVTSFLEKIGRKGYSNPFEDVEDIVGFRIVCLYISDLPRLQGLIAETFDILHEEDKVKSVAADTFGYMSVHFICRLRPEHNGPHYDGLKELKFEVQCRTVLMDAWANVSHHLAYKGETSIPDELKRDFHALSGLFYVADRHFEIFATQALGSRKKAVEEAGAQGDAPINLDTVMAYLAAEYPAREQVEAEHVSEFVEEVETCGYKTIGDLDRTINRAKRAALQLEKKYPPLGSESRRFASLGLARQALAIADKGYADFYYRDDHRFAEFRKGLE